MGVSRVAGGVVVAAGVAAGVVVGLFGLVGHLEAVGDLNSVGVVAISRQLIHRIRSRSSRLSLLNISTIITTLLLLLSSVSSQSSIKSSWMTCKTRWQHVNWHELVQSTLRVLLKLSGSCLLVLVIISWGLIVVIISQSVVVVLFNNLRTHLVLRVLIVRA